MLEKKTVLDQIEITRDGSVQFRIGLLIIEDGNEVACNWHRSRVEPGGNVDEQMSAVNVQLKQMGRDALDAEAIDKIKNHSDVAWTPKVVEAFADKRRAAEMAASVSGAGELTKVRLG